MLQLSAAVNSSAVQASRLVNPTEQVETCFASFHQKWGEVEGEGEEGGQLQMGKLLLSE